ncbi:MAG: hypothetical protein R3248_07385 [Candidatus Promineifilaceae bacterium]|nr:hypothetical protein [Candidatus Promineifilaceae bacterium]
MRIPSRLPGLKAATILLAIYAVAWIALEGHLLRVVGLAVGLTLVALGHGVQRYVGGRRLSLRAWLALAAGCGLAAGAGSGVLTLLFMALKTGLHAHGPEFAAAEIHWVASRLVGWAAGGLLAGLGIALLLAGLTVDRR